MSTASSAWYDGPVMGVLPGPRPIRPWIYPGKPASCTPDDSYGLSGVRHPTGGSVAALRAIGTRKRPVPTRGGRPLPPRCRRPAPVSAPAVSAGRAADQSWLPAMDGTLLDSCGPGGEGVIVADAQSSVQIGVPRVVEFRLLGPVEAWLGGRPLDLRT